MTELLHLNIILPRLPVIFSTVFLTSKHCWYSPHFTRALPSLSIRVTKLMAMLRSQFSTAFWRVAMTSSNV